MSDCSAEEWPNYSTFYPGPNAHLHAIGVLSSCFNSFERIMFDLYLHHFLRKKLPISMLGDLYLGRDHGSRISAIKEIFQIYERRKNVRDRIENLCAYFDWCSKIRNILVHAEVLPALVADLETLHIAKRKAHKKLDLGYQSIDLKTLRTYADLIQEGRLQAAKINVHLRYRDKFYRSRSLTLRAHGPEPLPKRLVLPRPPTLLDSPSHVPEHIFRRQSSRQ